MTLNFLSDVQQFNLGQVPRLVKHYDPLDGYAIKEKARTIQKNSILKQCKRRPYRPSTTALGLIRSFMRQPEKCDTTEHNLTISTTRFRLSSEALQLIRPFIFQLEKSRDTELTVRCAAIQFRPSSEARKSLRPFM